MYCRGGWWCSQIPYLDWSINKLMDASVCVYHHRSLVKITHWLFITRVCVSLGMRGWVLYIYIERHLVTADFFLYERITEPYLPIRPPNHRNLCIYVLCRYNNTNSIFLFIEAAGFISFAPTAGLPYVPTQWNFHTMF